MVPNICFVFRKVIYAQRTVCREAPQTHCCLTTAAPTTTLVQAIPMPCLEHHQSAFMEPPILLLSLSSLFSKCQPEANVKKKPGQCTFLLLIQKPLPYNG